MHSVSQWIMRGGLFKSVSDPTLGKSCWASCTSPLPMSASREMTLRLLVVILLRRLLMPSGEPPQLRWTCMSPAY